MASSEDSSSTSKKVVLVSSDGEEFAVDAAVARQSEIINGMLFDATVDVCRIPLSEIDGATLAKIIKYCKRHAEGGGGSNLDAWDAEFLKVDVNTLHDLMQAANFLNIENLLNLTCNRAADLMKGKSPEQIRQIFHIQNDFTPEEEEEISKQNEWAFDRMSH